VAPRVNRGDLWLYDFRKPDKRRPVLVLSRDDVIPLLDTVTVAPITSTIHGAPSEVVVGSAVGLKHDSAINLDHVQTVSRSRLRTYLGHADEETMQAVCRALAIALGCR
jgi:mRNA interferase MazF